MRLKKKLEDGSWIWFDSEEEYLAYLEATRNSWPNRLRRFFYKVLAVIVVILVLLFMVGVCAGQDKTKASEEKTETELMESNNDIEESVETSDHSIDKEIIDEEESITEEENLTEEEVDALEETE